MLNPSQFESTHGVGNRGEELVCARLVKKGMQILDRNHKEKFAEIDIVARDGDTLCFVEVRTRRDALLGHPSETVNIKKQKLIRRAAEAYMARKGILQGSCAVRFDVATIVWETEEFLYLENAF